jgi:multidrug efflux pump subunit AcrA (membrane-fusion protein)
MKTAVIGFLAAATVGAGCSSGTPRAADKSAPVTVTVTRVSVTDFAVPVEAGGVVRARATTLIASRMMAPITQVHVRPGDRVRRGTTLVTLDARDVQANSGRAEAAAVAADQTARAAEADVRAAASALVLARATHDRMATLHAKRSATAQELDQTVAALAAAEAQRTSAEARLAAAHAARDAAQASAESATISASYTVLTAPFDGVVTERHADPGTMAIAGATLLTLEDATSYRLEVQLDEARAVLARTGQTVSVRLDNAPDAGGWIDGRVAEIARLDPVSHRFVVKIDLPSSTGLRSGLYGRARFAGPTRRVVTVPASVLVTRGQLTFVYLVDQDGRARLRPISPGVSDHDRVEVLAGLREGHVIVADPPASLTDGARVAAEES